MTFAIYFNDRKLQITNAPSSVMASAGLIRWEDSKQNLAGTLRYVEASDQDVAIVTSDPATLFESFKKHFEVIQAAGGLVLAPENLALMIYRKGKWDLPKGKLDDGEDLEACALREIEEETGIRNLSIQKPLCITYHTYHQDGAHILKESHWYLIKAEAATTPVPQKEEGIEKCIWVGIDSLPSYAGMAHGSVGEVIRTAIADELALKGH